jgi:acyl-CoA thioesterase YciA
MRDTEPNPEPLASLPPGKEPTLRVVPMPADANFSGDIFGGWVMSHVDIAGSIPATRRARGRVATVAVNSFVFRQPVLVGDVVSFYADVVKVGRTSITVDVQVYAQRNPVKEECVKVTEAALTYVAVDENGRPRVVPTQQLC